MKNKDILFVKKTGSLTLKRGKINKNQCSGCGFIYGGALMVHNGNEECPIMGKLKVKEIISSIGK